MEDTPSSNTQENLLEKAMNSADLSEDFLKEFEDKVLITENKEESVKEVVSKDDFLSL